MIKRIRNWLVDHHWLHDWDRWKRYQVEYRRVTWEGEAGGAGWQTRQSRLCKRCGYTQDKKICG